MLHYFGLVHDLESPAIVRFAVGCVFNAFRTRISGDEVGHAIAYELLSYECECAWSVGDRSEGG